MILEKTVTSIDELTQVLNSLPNHYVFRGQCNAKWGLQSALERLLGRTWAAEKATKFEAYSLTTFQSKYHIYCGQEHTPKSKLAWLSVMQHYGVPTRLIDFTTSPYIALYFALEKYDPLLKQDFSIFLIDYSSLMENSLAFIKKNDRTFLETRTSMQNKQDEVFELTIDRRAYDIAWLTEPTELNARIDRQSGTFLMTGNLGQRIEDVLNSATYRTTTIQKIVIPAKLYESVYVGLRKMSINAKSIYGDLAGLASSIQMELRNYASE
ncbi:MAG: FRG domain-containing protein [Polaromonas sp.]|uniref:FRG domain-containing protein n=1 Tax=Polaromonas sp. TaxID=1869339 RepID=UPI0025F0E733|nr:FRG domain-containing protein [Polaromonas sp.]MBI2725653.1 FRG domain-containing protein [Polaromonas sp.]